MTDESLKRETTIDACQKLAELVNRHTNGKGNGIHSTAIRLMLAENADATYAAYQVGYESPSQFSREYSRMFGAPPMKDIERLRIA